MKRHSVDCLPRYLPSYSSFRIHFHSLLEKIATFFTKVSPSFRLAAAFIFTPPPFALNEFHSANRRESLPSSTGFLLFTRFLPPSRQFPWLFFNFHAYFLPPPSPFLLCPFDEKLFPRETSLFHYPPTGKFHILGTELNPRASKI